MTVIRVVNLSNTRLLIGDDDYIKPKSIRDFAVDVSNQIKKQLVSYASMGLAKVFEVDIPEKTETIIDSVEGNAVDVETKPKQSRKSKKK